MKLNKKVLASSLTAAVALLGTVAPATGVFAATSTVPGATDVNLSTEDHLGVGDKADALMGAQAQSGTAAGVATAQSDAQVGVLSDVLTLDAVPDFNFGNGIPGKTINLHNNTGAKNDDGNAKGLLQISDSRSNDILGGTTTYTVTNAIAENTEAGTAAVAAGTEVYKQADGTYNTVADGSGVKVTAGNVTTDTKAGDLAGYTLKLAVGNFEARASNGAAAATGDATKVKDQFKLVFGQDNLNNTAWSNTDGTVTNFVNAQFTSDDTPQDFVEGAAGQSLGRAKAYLNGDHADDIQLAVPEGANGGYNATLTWTLQPGVPAVVNA